VGSPLGRAPSSISDKALSTENQRGRTTETRCERAGEATAGHPYRESAIKLSALEPPSLTTIHPPILGDVSTESEGRPTAPQAAAGSSDGVNQQIDKRRGNSLSTSLRLWSSWRSDERRCRGVAPAMGRRIVPLIWLSVARSGVSHFTCRPRTPAEARENNGAAQGFRLPTSTSRAHRGAPSARRVPGLCSSGTLP